MVTQAKKGKVNAAQHLIESVEGKPRQAFDMKLSIMDELAQRIEEARKRVKQSS